MSAEHSDPLLDALALVEADARGDEPGLIAVARHCDLAAVRDVLLDLLALVRADRAAGGHVVIGLFIWARIDDQRQRSFVTANARL